MGNQPTDSRSVVHSRRRLYHGRAFSFEVQDVTLPNGARTEMAAVRHPGSTGIVPLRDDGTVVMLRQYRPVVGDDLLEIPAGTMEPGETPEACARRELQEETGLTAHRWTAMGKVHILPSYSDEIIHLYLVEGLRPATRRLDSDEIIDCVDYGLDDLMAMIAAGTITDALTVLALERAQHALRSR